MAYCIRLKLAHRAIAGLALVEIVVVMSLLTLDEITRRASNIIRRWHELAPEDEQPYN